MSAVDVRPSLAQEDLLRVQGLSVALNRRSGGRGVRLVRDATFSIAPGEVCCLVGESGSGKSVTALALMGLIQRQPGITASGEAWFGGAELLSLPEAQLRALRGREMAMVFQEPMTYLDPIFTVQDQLQEAVRRREHLRGAAERERMRELLTTVGIHDPERILVQHPHQMSGGMCQRVMLAMALAARPRLLLADEPTTAIDATLQVQVIALIDHLRATTGMSVLLVTHDMGV
ncbi:MAG: ABC transporter ATP-binding protein, partial [Candidatus Dormibacteraceae bacterium]